MSEKNTKSSDTHDMAIVRSDLIPGVYVIGCVVLLVYAISMFWFGNGISKEPSDWGTLGDYFGGLMNPVISFATLLVAYAVWKLQRVELDETKKALKDQAETAKRQRQEQRFFDLLNVYYRTVDALRFDETSGGFGSPVHRESFHGKDALRQWFLGRGAIHEFLRDKGQYNKASEPDDSKWSNADFLASLRREWEKTDKSNRFGALLRTIELVFTTASMVLSRDQRPYLDLLRAQLSDGELSLIGYQLLFEENPSRLRLLVEQFGLLEHMSRSDLRSALENVLPHTAFAPALSEPRPKGGETPC